MSPMHPNRTLSHRSLFEFECHSFHSLLFLSRWRLVCRLPRLHRFPRDSKRKYPDRFLCVCRICRSFPYLRKRAHILLHPSMNPILANHKNRCSFEFVFHSFRRPGWLGCRAYKRLRHYSYPKRAMCNCSCKCGFVCRNRHRIVMLHRRRHIHLHRCMSPIQATCSWWCMCGSGNHSFHTPAYRSCLKNKRLRLYSCRIHPTDNYRCRYDFESRSFRKRMCLWHWGHTPLHLRTCSTRSILPSHIRPSRFEPWFVNHNCRRLVFQSQILPECIHPHCHTFPKHPIHNCHRRFGFVGHSFRSFECLYLLHCIHLH